MTTRVDDAVWLPAPGLPDYEISSDGRVRSIPRWVTCGRPPRQQWISGGELKLQFTTDGYPRVSVQRKSYKVHQLVCTAFHGPRPSPQHEVRHLNDVKTDNRPENLRWGTVAENARDKVVNGRHPGAEKTHCKQGHPFSAENTRVNAKGHRICIECHNSRNRIVMAQHLAKKSDDPDFRRRKAEANRRYRARKRGQQ